MNLNTQDVPVNVMIDSIMPYVLSYQILPKGSTPDDLNNTHLYDLGMKWKVKWNSEVKSNKKGTYATGQLDTTALMALHNHSEIFDNRRGARRPAGAILAPTHSFAEHFNQHAADAKVASKTAHLNKLTNYFGLPPYALNRTAEGIIYQCRKPYAGVANISRDELSESKRTTAEQEKKDQVQKKEKKVQNSSAQRKVAAALASMADTPNMLQHFVYKGGIDAVSKLSYESTDPEVLASCASSIGTVSLDSKHCKFLLSKQAIPLISCLIENGDELTKYLAAVALGRMSNHEAMDIPLVGCGILLPLQSLLGCIRTDSVSFALMSISNICGCLTGNDAEAAVRLCMQGCKRLDFVNDFESAYFISQVFNNLTRINAFVTLICEEGVLPVLISLLECQPYAEVVEGCSEAFFNLSMLRKNRRDIYGSGVAAQMVKMLNVGSSKARAYCLLMVGNLLGAGLFQDKIAKADILRKVISLLIPDFSQQCLAASYVISHLSHFSTPCEIMLFDCSIIPKILELLGNATTNDISTHAVSYLWTALANMSHARNFFLKMMEEKDLATNLSEEAAKGENQEIVAQLMLNMSEHPELLPLVGPPSFAKLVLSFKTLFIRGRSVEVKRTAVNILINLCICIEESRVLVLANDLIEIIEESELEVLNTEFITLIYLISKDPALCPKLVDAGAQRLLMAIVPSVKTIYSQDVIAASLHNLSMKRALLGTGVLASLMLFSRNCMSIRVLWITRTIANMSSFPRSRAVLAKEKKLIPCLAAIMRYGCLEAERVQHYSALAICNVIGSHLEKTILEGLIKSGTVTDLVVVTLLRVNAIDTKEILGKALFNLLSRADMRKDLVNLDVLEALVELSRIDKAGLLDLSVKTVYNITCETNIYRKKLLALKIPSHMISRTLPNAELQGTRATNAIKLVCGKALANMSFDDDLAKQMSFEKIAESCNAICSLKSDEARYSACVTLFNLSFLDNKVVLANSVAIPMLVSILSTGPILSLQLAVAALTNFSTHQIFLDQLTSEALGAMIKAISQATLDKAIKDDCVFFIYNVVTQFEPAHQKAVEDGVIIAMGKMVKTLEEESMLGMIGRIIKECASVESLSRKMLGDGIMPIIAKLAKYEYPTLKLDLASALCSLSFPVETSHKMLKHDAIDLLFWLTLHDCMGLYDSIKKFVVRTVRNFTLQIEDALYMVKEDRFIAVMRTFMASRNDDVLWHTAVVIYNLLNPPSVVKDLETGQYVGGKRQEMLVQELKATLLKRGIIQLIFDAASSGGDQVRHLCSACLHSVAEHIPNSDDPAVLQLIMCLLDAEGDQFTQLANRVINDLEYENIVMIRDTSFRQTSTNFQGNWQPEPCQVDSIFNPAEITLEVKGSDQYATKPLDSKIVTLEQAVLLKPETFKMFKNESKPENVKKKKKKGVQTHDGSSMKIDVSSPRENNWDDGSGADSTLNYFSDAETFMDQSDTADGKSLDDYRDGKFGEDMELMSTPSVVSPRPPGNGSRYVSDPKMSPSASRPSSSDAFSTPTRRKKKSNAGLIGSQSVGKLPSLVLGADKPALPNDTLKALSGTQYNPKRGGNTVNSIKGSFENSSKNLYPPIL